MIILCMFEYFSLQDDRTNDRGSAPSNCDIQESLFLAEGVAGMSLEQVHVGVTPEKIISIQEYKTLMQLIPEVNKLRISIEKMKEVIQSKDSQLKDLRKDHQLVLQNHLNISHLSDVSMYFEFIIFRVLFSDIYFCIQP